MQPFPHRYSASATAGPEGYVLLNADGLPPLISEPPVEFDGPGDRWSPETLVVGAVADCFVLTFRAIARLSKVPWTAVTCQVSGTVDRIDRAAQFTALSMRAVLEVPAGANEDQASRLLERAKQNCLITRSLKASCRLDALVRVVQPAV